MRPVAGLSLKNVPRTACDGCYPEAEGKGRRGRGDISQLKGASGRWRARLFFVYPARGTADERNETEICVTSSVTPDGQAGVDERAYKQL